MAWSDAARAAAGQQVIVDDAAFDFLEGPDLLAHEAQRAERGGQAAGDEAVVGLRPELLVRHAINALVAAASRQNAFRLLKTVEELGIPFAGIALVVVFGHRRILVWL